MIGVAVETIAEEMVLAGCEVTGIDVCGADASSPSSSFVGIVVRGVAVVNDDVRIVVGDGVGDNVSENPPDDSLVVSSDVSGGAVTGLAKIKVKFS